MPISSLTNEEKNFTCVLAASLQLTKQPLKDILASQIKPSDLKNRIKSSLTLLSGKHQLTQEQKNICNPNSAACSIDYDEFDVSLLYKLIRNLCPSLKPTNGWGNAPGSADILIGDDIERLRIIRNNYAHPKSERIVEADFKAFLGDLKWIIKRIQSFLVCGKKYEQKLLEIEQEWKYVPEILIKGPKTVICGDKALFEADVRVADPNVWSITWRKLNGKNEIVLIEISKEKYSGSTKKQLLIPKVCKQDEGKYDAILSRDIDRIEYKSKNTIDLIVLGELPQLKDLEVTTEDRKMTIHCIYEVPGQCPKVHDIKWSKDDQALKKNNKLDEGIHDNQLTILSPTSDDKGKYKCTIVNAVGSVSKDVTLNVPIVKIPQEQAGCFGSEITITPSILSIPSPKRANWQRSQDGIKFKLIHINDKKYVGSSDDPECPKLVISKATFDDRLYYRLLVCNEMGEGVSNTVHLNITGSPPNITTSLETNIKSRYVKLIGTVSLYDGSPDILEVFWTKNGKKINPQKTCGKLSGATINDPSLIIREVCRDDAGCYQLTAMNAVGSTRSDKIILGQNGEEKIAARLSPTLSEKAQQLKKIFEKNTSTESKQSLLELKLRHQIKLSSTKYLPDQHFRQLAAADQNVGIPFTHEPSLVRVSSAKLVGATHSFSKPTIENPKPLLSPSSKGSKSETRTYKEQDLQFISLCLHLARHFPYEKLDTLKFILQAYGKLESVSSLERANSAVQYVSLLLKNKLLTSDDVIFMQFICNETECEELYIKCLEYALAHEALCFFFKKTR